MSHFTVLVIGQDVERQLQPFHEFECTGTDDEFVQDIDKTEEALAMFAEATVTRFRAPDGVLHDPFDEKGNWKPEFCTVNETDPFNRREKFLPPGYEEVDVPAKDYERASEWISGYYGWNVLTAGSEPGEDHKYGRIEVDADGNVIRCIDRTNPNRKWDWWVVGGRWAGFFKLKPGASGERGNNGLMGSCRNNGAGFADHVRKGAVDIDGMRDDAGTKAGEHFDRVHAVIAGRDWLSWEHIRDAEHKDDIDAARKAYHEQPVIEDLSKTDLLGWGENLERYRVTRDEFVASARANAITTFAVIKDGQWYERGRMGWWGCVSGEKDVAEWGREFSELIDSLPDDTMLTIVDCHI